MATDEEAALFGVSVSTVTTDSDSGELVLDLDLTGAIVSGLEDVAQNVARLVEPVLVVAMNANFDQEGDDLARIVGDVQEAAEQDERVDRANVLLEYDQDVESLDVEVTCDTALGPFTLTGSLTSDMVLRIVTPEVSS